MLAAIAAIVACRKGRRSAIVALEEVVVFNGVADSSIDNRDYVRVATPQLPGSVVQPSQLIVASVGPEQIELRPAENPELTVKRVMEHMSSDDESSPAITPNSGVNRNLESSFIGEAKASDSDDEAKAREDRIINIWFEGICEKVEEDASFSNKEERKCQVLEETKMMLLDKTIKISYEYRLTRHVTDEKVMELVTELWERRCLRLASVFDAPAASSAVVPNPVAALAPAPQGSVDNMVVSPVLTREVREK